MTLSDLLAEFGRRIGLDLALGPRGTASLLLEGVPAINLESADDGRAVHLYVVLGPLPRDPAERSRATESLLAANLFGEGSGAARFALDPLADEVVLCRTLPVLGTDAAKLEEAIGEMATRAEDWGRRAPDAAPADIPPEPVVAETWIRG